MRRRSFSDRNCITDLSEARGAGTSNSARSHFFPTRSKQTHVRAARSPGCTEMARYTEDVYYETAIKLTREAAQVSIHRKHDLISVQSEDSTWLPSNKASLNKLKMCIKQCRWDRSSMWLGNIASYTLPWLYWRYKEEDYDIRVISDIKSFLR